jgi:hypothetical protein
VKRYVDGVLIFPDGREVCDKKSLQGREEYKRRIWQMRIRQKGICCLCGLPLRRDEATFEHQAGRGMNGSHRDDRIVVDGKPQNGAAHVLCNAMKGSRRMRYSDYVLGWTKDAAGSSGVS